MFKDDYSQGLEDYYTLESLLESEESRHYDPRSRPKRRYVPKERKIMRHPTESEIINTLVIMLNVRHEFTLQIPDSLIERCTEMCQAKKRSFKLTSPKMGKPGKTLSVDKVQ